MLHRGAAVPILTQSRDIASEPSWNIIHKCTHSHEKLMGSLNALPLTWDLISVTLTTLYFKKNKHNNIWSTIWNPLHLLFFTKWTGYNGEQQKQMFIIPATAIHSCCDPSRGSNSSVVLFMMKLCSLLFIGCGFITHCKFVLVSILFPCSKIAQASCSFCILSSSLHTLLWYEIFQYNKNANNNLITTRVSRWH